MGFLSKLFGGSKPRQPNIEKDSLASVSTAKILYGLAEGEISGLVNGAKSIKLDDTPLLNDAGQPNFSSENGELAVKWDFRSGSNTQEYIKGFPDVANEKPVNVQLRQATPYVKQINDINLSAIVVRVSFGALRKQKTNGDITGTTVKYRIDLMTDNGNYQTVIDSKVTAKTSAKYERSHRIDLPKARNGWLVKVTRITPDSTSDLLSNSMSIEAITEIIDVKLSYPNTAMLGIQYDARTFSNIAKLSVRCRGKLLQIPSNYDPVARTYNGIWDGTFKTAYSNNPAWVFYDLCLNWRYGLGKRLDASMIDKWALYQIARYCDEMVSDGLGGQEPRFAINVYLQSQQDAFTVLQSLSSIFRGIAYWDGEQVTVAMDAPQTPVYTFSRANVVDGIFNDTGTRARDRHTVAKVAWDNPKTDFKTEYEFVRDEYAIAKYGINQLDINMMGCTSQGQAQRAGLWALKSEQLESRQVSFSIGLDGMLERIKPSAIIAISDEVFAGRANGGRIVAISTDKKTITLDRAVTANVGDTLVINNSDGVAERQTISAINGADITVSVAFDKPEAQHIWAIDSPDLRLMLFKIISIKQNDDLTHTVTAIQHEPQKYAAVDSGAYVQPQRVSVVEPNIVAAPEAVAIGQFERQIQGQTVVTMTIGWTQVKDAVSYLVEFKRDDGNWVKLAPQGGLSVDVEGVYAGNYLARVTAVNAYDLQSMPKTSMLTAVVGKLGTPPRLASLKATGILFGMQLDWLFAQGSSDTNYTEIQVASAPDTNVTLLGTYAYPTNTATINGLQGNLTQFYRGRIVDKLGNVSTWTNWVKGVTDDNAEKVLDLLNGQITESQLYKDLGAKIEKIGTLETGLSQEIQDRVDALAQEATNRTNAINQETENRIAAVKVNTDAIAAERDARIADIKTNADAINQETQSRITAIKSVSDGLTQEITDRQGGDQYVLGELTTYKTSNDNALAAVQTDVQTVTTAQSATATKLDGVYSIITPLTADSNQWAADSGSNQASSWTLQSSFVNADNALSSRIDTLSATVGGNTAAITSEQTARVNADSALSSRIDSYVAQTDGNISTIKQDVKANANAVSANSGAITALDGRVTTIDANTNTAMQNAASAVTKADTAVTQSSSAASLAQSASATATTAKNTADTANTNAATALSKANVAADSASATASTLQQVQADLAGKASTGSVTAVDSKVTDLGGKVTANTTKLDGVYAKVTPLQSDSDTWTADSGSNQASSWTLQSSFVNADNALSSRIDTLSATVGGNTAAITSEQTARVNADSALSSRIDSYVAQTDGNISTIKQDVKANANAVSANSGAITALDGRVTTIDANTNTAMQNAASAVTKADTAVTQSSSAASLAQSASATATTAKNTADTANTNAATALSKANVAADSASATASTLQQVQADLAGKASTGSVTAVDSKVTDLGGKVTANTTKLDGVYAKVTPLQSDSDTWTADSGSNQAAAWSIQSALVDADNALSSRIDSVTANINGNTAAIVSEQTARVNADNALSSRIDSVTANINGNTAAIVSEQTARVNADNALSSRIDTVQSSFNTNLATVQSNIKTLSDAQSATASKVDTVQSATAAAQSTADAAKTAATNAAMAAGNKGEVIFGSGTPPASKQLPQNLWIDTTGGGNKPKRWNGSAWIVVTDKAATDAATAASNAQATADSALAKANANATNIATVQSDVATLTTAQGATASRVDTIQTTVDGHTSSIQTQQQSINGLNAQYTVKVDVGGRVSGFGLASSSTQSDFAIRADKFYIAPPSGTGKGDSPFMVLTTPKTINGTTVPAGTYIKNAYIADGSITATKIQVTDLSAISANLGSILVDAANIKDSAITSAKIGNAQVDTLQIAGEAVIVPRVQFTATEFDFYSIDIEEVVNSITVDAKGGAVAINFGFDILTATVNSRGADPTIYLRLRRNGTLLRTINFKEVSEYYLDRENDTGRTSLKSGLTGKFLVENYSLVTYLDVPPAGNVTYTVTLESRGLNAGKDSTQQASTPVKITARSLHIMGVRR